MLFDRTSDLGVVVVAIKLPTQKLCHALHKRPLPVHLTHDLICLYDLDFGR